jgi:small glutamine-rich tetratricopeptide repeat-containing protein alpha
MYRHGHFCLGNFEEAIDAYERGLRLDPGNASMKQSLSAAKQKLSESGGGSSSAATTRGGGIPGMGEGGLPDLGGMGGLASMMNNPMFMSMGNFFFLFFRCCIFF